MLRKRALVTPDKHFPYADIPAVNAVCKAIELVKSYKPPKKNLYKLPGETGFAAMKLALNNMNLNLHHMT